MPDVINGFQHSDTGGSDLPYEITLAFAPLHRRAFGTAVGLVTGLTIFLITCARLIVDPEGQSSLMLLSQYFYGYTESWTGALIGAAWGMMVGFVAGWFVAFCRNLTIATWIFAVRSRAELTANRDFLDHI